ncbi:hypothetical protein BDQ17DRAFT_1369780 [Cyathus striatus]|nr:hypothetical protein BDQ17DRAFT_1369780 [Cyathus striatus]
MDVLSLIPLVDLTIHESREPKHILWWIHANDPFFKVLMNALSFIPFSRLLIRQPYKPKYMQLPDDIKRPLNAQTPSLKKLKLYPDKNGTNICSWVLERQPFNFSALTTLHISLASIEDISTGWGIALLCANTLENFHIFGEREGILKSCTFCIP